LLSEEILAQRLKAQKRAAIGLEPERVTAGRVTYRPAQSAPVPLLRWSAVILAALLLLAAVWFILYAQPSWGGGTGQDQIGLAVNGPLAGETQLLRYDFDRPVPTLAQHNEPGAWAMGFVDGLYRIRSATSDSLVYTTLGLYNPDPYRLETQVTISPETPWSYAGVMARVQNGQNFYLFQIDGQGQFQVILLQEGKRTSSTEWSASPAVRPAGQPNLLGVMDDGRALTFSVNGVSLDQITEMILPTGDLALAGGSDVQPGSEADFDWVAVYQIPAPINP